MDMIDVKDVIRNLKDGKSKPMFSRTLNVRYTEII